MSIKITDNALSDELALEDMGAVLRQEGQLHLYREISDACARTVAMGWQSSGTVGSVLAALASGCEVDVTALLDDISATVEQQPRHEWPKSLELLSTWAIRKNSVRQ